MPRRSILSAAERESLFTLPETNEELIWHYTFSESDLSIINQRRGAANRLGFAVQLCYLRFPGIILGVVHPPTVVETGCRPAQGCGRTLG
jgi:TnpA family transposase